METEILAIVFCFGFGFGMFVTSTVYLIIFTSRLKATLKKIEEIKKGGKYE